MPDIFDVMAADPAYKKGATANHDVFDLMAAEQRAAQRDQYNKSELQRMAKQGVTSPEAELRQANRPLEKGLETAANEAGTGFGRMSKLTPSGLIGGAAQIVNAPFAGAGNAVGTTVHNYLAGVPGLGGVSGALPAAGAAIADAVTQMATGQGAMTPLIRGATKAVGRFIAPAATRTAAGEAALEKLGATGNMIDRAYEVPGSKAAYEAAAAQPPLPAAGVAREIRNAEASTSKALQARPARRVMRETAEAIHPTITPPEVAGAANMEAFLANKAKAADDLAEAFRKRPSTLSWRDAMDHVQGMKAQATEFYDRGLNTAGKAMSDAAEKVMAKLDSVSPVYAQANKLYNREQSINRVAEIFTKPGPSAKLGLLFQKDKMTRAAFDPAEAKMLEKVARYVDTIGATGSPYSGPGARILDLTMSGLSSMVRSKAGMRIMKEVFKGGVTPNSFSTAMQLFQAMPQSEEK